MILKRKYLLDVNEIWRIYLVKRKEKKNKLFSRQTFIYEYKWELKKML